MRARRRLGIAIAAPATTLLVGCSSITVPLPCRLARHTADHTGEPMALVINGEVVAVPFIGSPIPGGEISVTPATDNAGAFVERFQGCAR